MRLLAADCHKPDVQLRLPINRVAFDPSCDQGYGSERSPEDELPPPLPNLHVVYPPEAAALGIRGPIVKPPATPGFEFSFVTPGKCERLSDENEDFLCVCVRVIWVFIDKKENS